MTSNKHRQILRELGVLKRELQNIGLWSDVSPAEDAMMSSEPFCCDTMNFATWLQWIFVPRMYYMVESESALPGKSGIHPMAEEALSDMTEQVKAVLKSILRLDILLNQ